MSNASADTRQHHFSETPVFVGRGVRAVGTNECVSTNSMEKKTGMRRANQYSRTLAYKRTQRWVKARNEMAEKRVKGRWNVELD